MEHPHRDLLVLLNCPPAVVLTSPHLRGGGRGWTGKPHMGLKLAQTAVLDTLMNLYNEDSQLPKEAHPAPPFPPDTCMKYTASGGWRQSPSKKSICNSTVGTSCTSKGSLDLVKDYDAIGGKRLCCHFRGLTLSQAKINQKQTTTKKERIKKINKSKIVFSWDRWQ